ncbi:hypothetical protein J4218_01875 [Candidatus Pacearchaeota archaeon]|nr:hypothetical protein [uncultured archaeon]MBS3078845.1 hypothetical protein [Candidatus Pacearchaeota archaeon]
MINEKERPKWPMQRLKGMYFAMHCWKCKKFELPQEEFEQTEYEKSCEPNIQKIIHRLDLKEMRFKDFNIIIKNSVFCKFEKRDFSNNCPICKKFGVPNHF